MMQENERLEKQLDFIREIDKEKEIFRQTYLADASRKENDAEHAWHMAIMTMLLSEYAQGRKTWAQVQENTVADWKSEAAASA
jgi:5'-deoxynucleotidase YfbR-like HD superfamily hydrolase